MGFDLLEKNLRQRIGAGGGISAVRAPLRACPLGAHVDHQGGEVTGLALDHGVDLLFKPRDTPIVTLESVGFPGVIEIDLRRVGERQGDWGDYLWAVAAEMGEVFDLHWGFDGVMQGDLVGMGVSSSAAVMVAYCLALAEVNHVELGRAEAASSSAQAYAGTDFGPNSRRRLYSGHRPRGSSARSRRPRRL